MSPGDKFELAFKDLQETLPVERLDWNDLKKYIFKRKKTDKEFPEGSEERCE